MYSSGIKLRLSNFGCFGQVLHYISLENKTNGGIRNKRPL